MFGQTVRVDRLVNRIYRRFVFTPAEDAHTPDQLPRKLGLDQENGLFSVWADREDSQRHGD